jgi:CheY-like chemotaxis protein
MEQTIDFREKVSSLLKEADRLIKAKNYDEAMDLVKEAKTLDHSNPYVQAFFERIEIFKQKPINLDQPIDIHSITTPPPAKTKQDKPTVDIDENKLREQIEKEFQSKFKEELQKIEKALIKRVEVERNRFETEKNEIKKKYEEKLKEIEDRFSQANQNKFETELLTTEQRLREQFNAEQAFLENEMKQRLENEFQSKLEVTKTEQEKKFQNLIEQEKNTALEREKLLKLEYDQKLIKEIDKIKSENDKFKKEEFLNETENIKTRLAQEYSAKLEKELAKVKEHYENEKRGLQQLTNSKHKELEEQTKRILSLELQKIKERENIEFEKKRKSLEETVRAELTKNFSKELEDGKQHLVEEYDQKVQEEKVNFEKLKEEFTTQENTKLENVRVSLKKEMETKFIQKLESIQAQFTRAYDDKMELLGVYVPDTLEDKLKLYKKRLIEFWANGQPSVEYARKLMGLKELLDLSFEDHSQLEMDVRIELYISKIEESIKNKHLDLTQTSYLDELKKQYHINAVESSKLEPFILSLFMKLSTRGVILLVDDDELLLKTLENALIEHNYKVIASTSVNEALQVLEDNMVDLIISDIKFPDTQMDGFSFFTILQKHKHFGNVPFILMSVLGDGGIIRSGVQLGIDDYITKPIDMDFLLAVVEGKLKRYKNLRVN